MLQVRRRLGVWLALPAALSLACNQVDVVADPLDAGALRDAATPRDAARTDGSLAPPGCDHGDEPITDDQPLSQWLATRYPHALCTCGGLDSGGAVVVTATPNGSGSVAANGAGRLHGEVDGMVSLAGSMGLGLAPGQSLSVGGSLQLMGPLLGAGASLSVGGDAAVGGRIELERLEVGGRLTLPEGQPINVENLDAPEQGRGVPALSPPCPCAPQDRPQVSDWLARLADTATPWRQGDVLNVRCGRYLASDTSGEALALRVERDALWLVPGDVAVPSLTIQVAAGATLDVLVGGNLLVEGDMSLGGPDGGRVRLLIAGGGTLQLNGESELQGWLDAPDAELVVEAGLAVEGALLVRRLAGNGPVSVQHVP